MAENIEVTALTKEARARMANTARMHPSLNYRIIEALLELLIEKKIITEEEERSIIQNGLAKWKKEG